jgi:DNA helicase II / ATP-dependent DNA helicase PcrA
MPQTHSPTEEQAAIIAAVASGNQNLMISAYAGTAKSTTLEMAAPQVKSNGLALAFNKKIATELQSRLPANFKAQTLNSIGHGAWVRTLDRNSVQLDDRKIGKLVSAIAKEQKIQLLNWQWDSIRDAVKNAMQAGLSPNNEGSPLIEDTPENWRDIIDPMDQSDFNFLYHMAWDTLKASIDLARAGQMSFDDQIYCPTILGGNWPKYPIVFVDEAQDLSPLNHRMLSLCSTNDGLIVAVGDSRQAIYLFRGADAKSMNNMRSLRPTWSDLNLTLTFRCPRVIVARQQEHAPGYRAAPQNIDGSFYNFENFNEGEGWSWKDLSDKAAAINTNSMAILCRNNAPLMSMAFKLIRNGVGCQMLGRDIGRGLIQLTTKLAKEDSTPIDKFAAILTEWLDRESTIALANDKPTRVDKLTDQADCLRATIEGSSPKTVGELRNVLQRVFSRENGQVILSSIHRAKGLEWPLVVHLDPWRIPSKQSLMAALATGDQSQLQQEYNMRYVAETRTKHTLINANTEDFSNG